MNLDASAVGKVANGLRKREILPLHNVGEAVATFTAAKAVPHLRSRDDVKRRRLFAMKGAATPKLLTALLQLHSLLHQLHQIGGGTNAIFVLVTNHAIDAPCSP